MKEQIYTIPVTEAVDKIKEEKSCTCLLCMLYEKLQDDELNLILGASMMEPDIRIKTNKEGFCRKHFDMMLSMKNKLGLALMLQSHIDEVRQTIFPKEGLFSPKNKCDASLKPLEEHTNSIFILQRWLKLSYFFGSMRRNLQRNSPKCLISVRSITDCFCKQVSISFRKINKTIFIQLCPLLKKRILTAFTMM